MRNYRGMYTSLCAFLSFFLLLTGAVPASPSPGQPVHNDFNCHSNAHPNPVILLHGLGATYYEDINYLESFLQQQGFCTFSLTYGNYDQFSYVGGLKPINESAAQIGAFVQQVHTQTGASKVDIVGHSEGGFQTLYVPKFENVSPFVQTLVAIAPPSHGTTAGNLFNISMAFGNFSQNLTTQILDTVGCAACADLSPYGAAVKRLNDGKPIVQPGNALTVITSTVDEAVTPPPTAFVNETGVRNLYVQQFCPQDPVGHIGEAYDTNVWNLVLNALQNTPNRPFACSAGAPFRR